MFRWDWFPFKDIKLNGNIASVHKCTQIHKTKYQRECVIHVFFFQSSFFILLFLSGNNFEKWLKLVQGHLITNLQYVDIGLGHQSFHAEFAADNASFTFLIRDEKRCKSFLRQFTSKW